MPPMKVADEYQSRSRGYRQRLVRDAAAEDRPERGQFLGYVGLTDSLAWG